MPLTLVIGPANAAKAGWVLRAFREELARATTVGGTGVAEPLLVVPTADAVEPYQRELAASGAVFGGEVVTFRRLLDQIARRAGSSPRTLGFVARERVVRAAVRDASLDLLAASARTPGFPIAAGRLFSELQRALVTPERFYVALRQWAKDGDERRCRYAEEVAGLYAAYRRRLETLGRVDHEGRAWAAVDALRADPASWGGRHVFFYGFDDLTPAQLDAVEALVRVARTDVTLSLPYEAGRAAFAARAGTVQTLLPLAQADGRLVELGDRPEHYATPAARAALHHLERGLFEGGVAKRPPNGSVRLLEAGGERAEAELVGAALLELLRQGVAPEDIAVLVAQPEGAPLLEQVLDAYGVPVVRSARGRAADSRLGAGLLAYGRAALGGTAADVLTWLRTPGKLADAELADRLEGRVRRFEATTALQARGLWEGEPLRELDALTGAAAQGALDFLDVLESELTAISEAPHRRAAAVLDAAGHADARVAAELRSAAAELRGLAEADPALLGEPADVLEALGAVEVRTVGGDAGGVLLADPLSVRARRFRAVFVCGLQDGAFPRRPNPEPFLDDAERRELARASGLVLGGHEDVLARERHLFYTSVARAEEVLFLSFRSSDEEGDPQIPSPFIDDVRDLFTDELWTGRGRRLLAEVTWPPAQAPTPLELRRARAARTPQPEPAPLAPLADPGVLAELAARTRDSASAIESFAACGVRWLVESVLRPNRLDPDPEPMKRGALAHRVLERTLVRLRERNGSARLSPASLPAAREELAAAIAELGRTRGGVRAAAALRNLEIDLNRWLDAECEADTGMEPTRLEWSFGGDEDEHGPLELAGGMRVGGRVDRIDIGPGGTAIVRDYKNSKGYPRARWAEEGRMQAALYAAAARELLGLEPVAALYQPLAGADLRPRGAARPDAPAAATLVGNDVLASPEEFAALLAELERLAGEAAESLRAGQIVPCPERCTPRGCAYPGICRAPERAAAAEGPEAA